ncbi:MAG: hypothetical protein KME27_07045 [Lyngbya sp. HA4199-MV5]|jgi:predicted house-cleaning noncanonical NTP pyrophosphatase (MazG superfamily)|nr:hypothetical protein [Lyngbya sp. HA4199-MV5]
MDKIPELLLKLLENSPLAILLFGVFLIVLGGAEKLPLGSSTLTISSQVKVILLVVGIALTLISTLTLFKDKIFRLPKGASKEVSLKTQQKIETQKNTITKLEEIIKEIKEFIESRNDDVSLSLLDILNGVKDQAREFEKAGRESRLAAQWLVNHHQSILQSVKFSEINGKASDSFRAEIKRYVELMVESLEEAKYITPGARDIAFHIGNPFPYTQAMQALKAQIKQEVDNHQGLRETELERLNNCLDRLIEDIRYESSI